MFLKGNESLIHLSFSYSTYQVQGLAGSGRSINITVSMFFGVTTEIIYYNDGTYGNTAYETCINGYTEKMLV